MRFAPTEEQLEFAAAVRALLEDTCGPAELRTAWGGAVGEHVGTPGGGGRLRPAWSALVEMGAIALAVPEDLGGLGLGDDHLVLLALECGRAALPDPFSATAGVAVGLLSDTRDAAGQGAALAGEWLERVAGGAAIGVGFGAEPVVASAATCDGLVLVEADTIRLVAPQDVELEALESVDGSRRPAKVRSDGGTVLLDGAPGAAAADRATQRAATLTAAELVGVSRRMLSITVDYVAERRQFGVPVGSFQAVKHQLADAGLGVEFAWPLAAVAAHRLAGGEPAAVESSMAKLRASEAAQRVGRAALQCHGAIGYTVECDLHLYLKRSWALRRQHGGDDHHRAVVRGALLGAGA